MKKLLLSLALVLGMTSVASAVDVSLPAEGKKWNSYTWTQKGDNYSAVVENYSLLLEKGSSTNALVSPDQYSIRIYAGAKLTITAPEGVTFDKVAVTINSTGNKATSATASEGWTCSAFDNGAFTVTATTPQSSLTLDGAGKQLRVASFVITASGAGETPEVKTIDYADIAAFLNAANTTDLSRITGATTAVYQNGRYLWLKDNSGVVLAYNGGDIEMPKFANGQTVEGGITGKYQNYSNGQLQMSNLVAGTFKAGAQGAEVEPEHLQVEEVATDLVNTYVRFEGVTVAEGTAANNYVMSDASGEIALFNQFNNAQYYDVVEVTTGSNLTVYGFIAIHSGKLQIMPVKVTTASGKEVVAAPTFSVPAGAVAEGTQVAISCATEGATIYYTVDGTNPTAASTVYSTPVVINEALTIKAIAVKDGMDDSSVATAEYTIKAPVVVTGTEAMFNFTDPSTLNPAYSEADTEADNTNKKIDLQNGVYFTSEAITLSGVASGNLSRMYLQTKNNDWSFRFYKNSVLTVAADNGYRLVKIEFEPQTSNYATALTNCEFTDGTLADNVWTANSENVSSMTISNPASVGATIGLKTMKVTFEKSTQGVADIELGEEAPAEYYNLQGVRMNGELTPGLYIRRQGNKATKVIVK